MAERKLFQEILMRIDNDMDEFNQIWFSIISEGTLSHSLHPLFFWGAVALKRNLQICWRGIKCSSGCFLSWLALDNSISGLGNISIYMECWQLNEFLFTCSKPEHPEL